jgi:predicted TIM-barrel fold metal-dependent hydrolase
MSYLDSGKVIDLMFGLPDPNLYSAGYESFKPLYRDRESREFKMPAQYMFKDIPDIGNLKDPLAWTVAQMDKHNIERAMIGVGGPIAPMADEARKRFPNRFFFDVPADPNWGMDEIRRVRKAVKEYGAYAVSVFPCGCVPQVPINSKVMYPLYAVCIDLDIPIFVNAGVPGPRFPMHAQLVEHIDEVCWFFPELKFVMRHGAEPWEELAVKLMLKYPNLYYSTSAFAPKFYPKAIIDYANSRGADKVLYAGYFPMGLSLDRIFAEMRQVPFADKVWPKFLYENAKRLLKLP